MRTLRKLGIAGIAAAGISVLGVGLAGGQNDPTLAPTLTLETLQSQIDMLIQQQEELIASNGVAVSDPARLAEVDAELNIVSEALALRIAQYWGLRQGEDPDVVARYQVGRTPAGAWPS